MFSIRLLTAALASVLLAGVPLAQAADTRTPNTSAPVLQIGTHSLSTQEYRALALAEFPRDVDPGAAADPDFVREFADRLLLVDQARRAHMQDYPVVAARIRQATDDILAKAVQTRVRDTARIDEAQVQAQFDAHPHDYDEVRLSHLFVAFKPQGEVRCGTPLSDAQALARAQRLKQQLDAVGVVCRSGHARIRR